MAPQRVRIEAGKVLGGLTGDLAAQVVVHAFAQMPKKGGRSGDVQALAGVASKVFA